MEVVCELEGVSESKDRTLDPVDAPYRFLRVPGCAYLPVGVTGIEEATQAGLTAVADPLMRGGEEAVLTIIENPQSRSLKFTQARRNVGRTGDRARED